MAKGNGGVDPPPPDDPPPGLTETDDMIDWLEALADDIKEKVKELRGKKK